MKKLVLTFVCMLAISGAAFAQGYVNWSLSFTYVTVQTNATVYSPLFGGGAASGTQGTSASTPGGFYYALLYQPSGTVGVLDSSVWDGTWKSAAYNGVAFVGTNNTANLGRINVVGGGNSVLVPWANGTTNNIIAVGWSANLGGSWLVVSNELANWSTLQGGFMGQNVFFGETTLGYINPNLTSPGTPIVASAPGSAGLPIYSLNTQLYLMPVPEPATFALVGLGGLSLLLFRRRK
jgi:hypothetical protein